MFFWAPVCDPGLVSCDRAQELGVMDWNTAGALWTHSVVPGTRGCSGVTFPLQWQGDSSMKTGMWPCAGAAPTGNSLSALGCWMGRSHYLTPFSATPVNREQELQQANSLDCPLQVNFTEMKWQLPLRNHSAKSTQFKYRLTQNPNQPALQRDSQAFQGIRDHWGWKFCFRGRQMKILLLCLIHYAASPGCKFAQKE